ncbi:MAG: general secretion pathway protein GspK [Hyphomicrobium sp.]
MTAVPDQPKPAHRRDRGFALVAVIWIATLLAVVAFIFTTAVRSYIRNASADLATAEAEALAEAGVNLAILDLSGSRFGQQPRFPADGQTRPCRLPTGAAVTIAIRDEAGKIDLNTAGDGLIEALLVGLGSSAEDAQRRVAALADYRDDDDDRRQGGAEARDYRDAGLAASPKNAPLDSIEDLAGVLGFDSETVRRVRSFVTVHSGLDGLDPAFVTAELTTLLAAGSRGSDDENTEIFSDLSQSLPARFTSVSAKEFYGIRSEVNTDRGARFVREAVVSLGVRPAADRLPGESRSRSGGATPTYRIWRWHRGESVLNFAPQTFGILPPC